MSEQAPNIDLSRGGGRLVYDKERRTIVAQGDEWRPIETAPKDRPIWACDPARGYESKMRWNGHEWECIDWKGNDMGVGFYPRFWAPLPAPLKSGPRPADLEEGAQ